MKFLPIISISMVSLVLAGCAQKVVHAYFGESKPASEIAILKGLESQYGKESYTAGFSNYTELKAGEKKQFKQLGSEDRRTVGRKSEALSAVCFPTSIHQYSFPRLAIPAALT